MVPYYLLLLVFNLNGQYRTTVMNYPDRTDCMQAREVWASLTPPKNALYHHSLCLCLRGESSEEFSNSLRAIQNDPEIQRLRRKD